jgi:uncharacterized surface protein with fasciclin (FAS1) repeats
MRQSRTILAVLAVAAVAVTAVVAGATADTPRGPDKNIVETAGAVGKFKTLTSLLKRAGLAKTLQGEGPYTVFAPTDAAFDKCRTPRWRGSPATGRRSARSCCSMSPRAG